MEVKETYLKGCYIITPNIFEDERGCFYESFNTRIFKELTGVQVSFVQDNVSKSFKGVLRGLHFQTGNNAQAKLVQVLKGKVMDVCVDLREGSQTFGKYFSIILDEVNRTQLFIPRGFAHGFFVLEDNTVFTYKCDNFYSKDSEAGILYNDEYLNIDWRIGNQKTIISKKDQDLPKFKDFFKL
ncbi:dTDP-4-dehydrorhamnose 3,5-epimerase [Hyunsoonleella ulvae]|uniref:dTDP-4-dehydrorhamnose 3,5-epimerase n=1 Tax=Hyunsoonleella ulvae TaxID=2799948 RepID=UPI00193A7543|nr:dTDP-4-dehydrorhamnose 3,5-epimerase [Hyunsoonleella ulvae]